MQRVQREPEPFLPTPFATPMIPRVYIFYACCVVVCALNNVASVIPPTAPPLTILLALVVSCARAGLIFVMLGIAMSLLDNDPMVHVIAAVLTLGYSCGRAEYNRV